MACTEFRAHKIVLHMVLVHVKLCVLKIVTVGTNLYRLNYNLLIGIVFRVENCNNKNYQKYTKLNLIYKNGKKLIYKNNIVVATM